MTRNRTETISSDREVPLHLASEHPGWRTDLFDQDTKGWKCGEPYIHSLSSPPDCDPWAVLLEPLVEKDNAQCAEWIDSVQNILIFAGLFSAVVTAFAVESVKDLQQDPVVELLGQISSQLAGTSLGDIQKNAEPFSPSASTIRLNAFLFLSLILSLTTVLIGTTGLQWLREHQSFRTSPSAEVTFGLLSMREASLQEWYVPQIFSSLPLLLQSALILFFAAILEMLLNTGQRIILPVTVMIGATSLFLLLTVCLPTVQAFKLFSPHLNQNSQIPLPCPYKSPQSNAFRRLVTSSEFIFLRLLAMSTRIHWGLRTVFLPIRGYARRVYYRLGINNVDENTNLEVDRPSEAFDYMKNAVVSCWNAEGWLDFDINWMGIRDNYFQSIQPLDSPLYLHRKSHEGQGAWYDTAEGICRALLAASFNHEKLKLQTHSFIEYHCALAFVFPHEADFEVKAEEQQGMFLRNHYLTKVMGYQAGKSFISFPDESSNIIVDSNLDILHEDTALKILYAIHGRLKEAEISSPVLSRHLVEVYFRLVGYIFNVAHLNGKNIEWDEEILFNPEELHALKIYDANDESFTIQWAITLHAYFTALVNPEVDTVTFERNLNIHHFFHKYTLEFWRQLNTHDEAIDQVISTFGLISGRLTQYFNADHGGRLELLFYASAFHLKSFVHHGPHNHPDIREAVQSLLFIMDHCNERLGDVKETQLGQHFVSGLPDSGGQKTFIDEWRTKLFDQSVIVYAGRQSFGPAD